MRTFTRNAYPDIYQMLRDAIALGAAYLLTEAAMRLLHPDLVPWGNLWMLLLLAPMYLFLMDGAGMYGKMTFHYADRVARAVLRGILYGVVLCLAVSPFIVRMPHQTQFLGLLVPVLVLCQLLNRECVSWLVRHKGKNRKTKILLVGSNDRIREYLYYIHKTGFRVSIVGYVKVDGAEAPEGIRCAGHIDRLDDILNNNVVDEVVFDLPRDYMGEVEKHLVNCVSRGHTVKLAFDLFDLERSKSFVHSVGTLPILTYHTVSLDDAQLLAKRCMDIAGALVGLLVTLLLSVAIVPAILIDSRGPVLFRQKRVGRFGRVFDMYKFRSMCVDAEARQEELMRQNIVKDGRMFKVEQDPRVTRVGRFLRRTSLDEFPQFLNVLRGDMSLVGTRPPTPAEVARYGREHHRRISIKPGITGLWQVSGRSKITDFDEVVRLDTRYIDNWSITEDIRILARTLLVLLRRDAGAF